MTLDLALARLGPFARGMRPIRTLHRGPLKSSYLVERKGERMVVRVDAPAAAAFGLDRELELRVLHVAAWAGVGPAPLAWRTRAPAVLVTRYVPGRSWVAADLRDPLRLRQLALLLRRVHALAPAIPALDLPRALDRYAACAGGPEARELATEAKALLARLQLRHDALCHHDPIGANIVGYRQPMLIDWEYAARGDPLFDVAVILRHHALAPAGVAVLLGANVGAAHSDLAKRLVAVAAVYDRVRLLWGLALQRIAACSASVRGD